LIPESDLPGNSVGFEESPVNLSSLDVSTYSKLKIKATFETLDVHSLGTDEEDQPVYKYLQDLQTNSEGKLTLDQMEWDSYYFSTTQATGRELLRVSPSNPVNLLPGTTLDVDLYFEVKNTLLVTVLDASTEDPIFGASVHLNNPNYDKILPTDKNGKAYFLPLEPTSYTLVVGAPNYQTSTTTISVLGKTIKTIYLQPEQ